MDPPQIRSHSLSFSRETRLSIMPQGTESVHRSPPLAFQRLVAPLGVQRFQFHGKGWGWVRWVAKTKTHTRSGASSCITLPYQPPLSEAP